MHSASDARHTVGSGLMTLRSRVRIPDSTLSGANSFGRPPPLFSGSRKGLHPVEFESVVAGFCGEVCAGYRHVGSPCAIRGSSVKLSAFGRPMSAMPPLTFKGTLLAIDNVSSYLRLFL